MKEISEIEKKVTELKTDNEWLKKTVGDTAKKVSSMHDVFIKGDGKISQLNRTVYGNGHDGLVKKVSGLEKDINQAKGGLLFFKWLATLLGISNMGLILLKFAPLFL